MDLEINKEKIADAKKAGTIDETMEKILTGFTEAPALYIPVAARVKYLREKYPKYRLVTEQVDTGSLNVSTFKATISDENGNIVSTGHASEVFGNSAVNSTSHVENSETSAVGRACANMGIGVNTNIASLEEMTNATTDTPINSVEDIKTSPEEAIEESETAPEPDVVTEEKVLQKIAFFGIDEKNFSNRYVSKHHTFIIRNQSSLDDKVKAAFDALGFKEIKGVYKLRIKGDK